MNNPVAPEAPQPIDWGYAFFGVLVGLVGIFGGILIVRDQYWPAENSFQNGKALVWVNWWNALRRKPEQTRLTRRQKHVFGYIGMAGGFLALGGGILLALGY